MELKVTREIHNFLISNRKLVNFYFENPSLDLKVEAPHNWYFIIKGQKIPITIIEEELNNG